MSVINKNTINSVSPTLRDFLLKKNLSPVYPSLLNSLPSQKIGEPLVDTSVNQDTNVIPFGLPLEEEGVYNMELQVIQNKFKNNDSNNNDLIQIENQTRLDGPWGDTDFENGLSTYPRSANTEIDENGLLAKTNKVQYRVKATTKNLYLDESKQTNTADYISLQPNNVTQNVKGYLDTYGSLNTGDGDLTTINTIGSILNGQGVGINSNGGIETNFDIRASLAGRVLGATGMLNDTKLGIIGGQQLLLALANNTAFNVQQEILGTANAADNTLSLINNGTLAGFRPNYKVTIASSVLGQTVDKTTNVLGFTIPKSYLSDAGSLFQSESGGNIDNVTRANSMILNTGKGQVVALLKNAMANLNGISSSGYDSPLKTKFRSGFSASYTDNKGEKQINGNNIYAYSKDGVLINLLAANDDTIPNISFDRTAMTEGSGFRTPEMDFVGPKGNGGYSNSNIKNPGFSWTTANGEAVNNIPEHSEITGDKKSLLVKTQQLFNSTGMLNIVTKKGDMNKTATQIQTAVVGGGISKGNPVMQASVYTEDGVWDGRTDRSAENTYCRSWTTLSRYDTVNKLVRHRDLYVNGEVPYRNKAVGSVLDDNGFPKISPYRTDSKTDPKKFMFSIENLAWCDEVTNLLPSEQGPGDLTTGKKGRIMWFPPYGIEFSESNSVNLESTNFIGRGEPIYTYNNTERTGTLSFKVVVDHASYVNSFSSSNGSVVDDHYVASFFAGCVEPTKKFADKLTTNDIQKIEHEVLVTPQKKTITPEPTIPPFSVYFPNDNANIPFGYETGLSGIQSTDKIDYEVYVKGYGIGPYRSNFTPGVTENWFDGYNYGLNAGVTQNGGDLIMIDGQPYYGWEDPMLLKAIDKFLTTKCPHCVVTVSGFASIQGSPQYNKNLAIARANYIITKLKEEIFTSLPATERDKRFKVGVTKEITNSTCKRDSTTKIDPQTGRTVVVRPQTDSIACKLDRKAEISFAFDPSLIPPDVLTDKPPIVTNIPRNVNSKITNRFYDEQNYFDKLKQEDNFIFDKFREKIRYFHPAFHSTTPEGLNSRLTFLLQCTRQGPTFESAGANNLAFGRPPVCILRIGDFYNTKIMMDNVSIDYEPLVWDLNPEGIGVQPMIANVNITFKIIGGSSLMGPINKLQNALSFNYFANTQVYDPRADYIAKDRPNEYKGIDKTDNSPIFGPVKESASGYYLNNGFSGDMNLNKSEFNSSVDTPQNIAQAYEIVMPDPVETEIDPDPVKNLSVVSFKNITCDDTKTEKNDLRWFLSVQMFTNVVNSIEADAQALSNDGSTYSLRITSLDGSESYQEKLNAITIGIGLTHTTISGNFSVPIKKRGDSVGISDKKGNYQLSLLKNNAVISNINTKLN